MKLRLHLYKKHLKFVFVPTKISNNDIRSFDVSFTCQIYSLAISNNDLISNVCCHATVLIIHTFITRLTTLLPKFLILTHKRCSILTMSSIRGYIWIGAVIWKNIDDLTLVVILHSWLFHMKFLSCLSLVVISYEIYETHRFHMKWLRV